MTLQEHALLIDVRGGDTLRGRVRVPVDSRTIGTLDDGLHSGLIAACREFTLDLGGADYVDSDGIRWLQRVQVEMEQRGVRFRVAARVGSRALRTLQRLRLENTLSLEAYQAEGAFAELAA